MLACACPVLAEDARIADCDADSHARTLVPLAPDAVPGEARAAWLDDRRLLWPGVAPEGPFALRSIPARGGASSIVQSTPLEVERDARVPVEFAYLGPGVVLAVPEGQAVSFRDFAWVEHGGERTGLQVGAALDARHAAAVDAPALGALPGPGGTTFRLWAPTADAVAVCLHADDAAPAVAVEPLVRDEATGVWSATLPAARAGTYYTYLVDVPVAGEGLVRNRVTDPYSVALGADSQRSVALDLDDPALAPPGWADDRAPRTIESNTDLVVYELHVRDFSVADGSVPAALRGKYLAFAEPASAGVDHLRRLAAAGVTDVHLLPVFDFATVPEAGCVSPAIEARGTGDREAPQAAVLADARRDCFNWGYDPLHFDVPEGSYATDAADGAVRVREFRAMVMALHRLGLRVGMDVVYNHMSASGQDPRSVLDRIVPGYYHRLDATGRVATSTCCANTATERAMMARLMLDSTARWVRDYHVDSFRFDLMGHQPRAVMETLQARVDAVAGRRVPLLGEGWNFGEVADGVRFVQASQRSLGGSGIATFSDRARDAVRGGGPADSGAALLEPNSWVANFPRPGDAESEAAARAAADLVRVGLAGTLRRYSLPGEHGIARPLESIDYKGQPAGYAEQPGEVVNYVENHDNQTLFDWLALKLPPETPSHERARVQVLAAATTAFSQGVAYVHAGLEILRSKSLDRNSYDSGDWFNRIDWSLTDNGFGRGLPPKNDNGRDWPLLAPRLADTRIEARPGDIRFARDAILDLLRIRAGTPLFRLRTAAEVDARLRLPPTGDPRLVVGVLDGQGRADAGHGTVLYAINVADAPRRFASPELVGKRFVPHPVHLAPGAADRRAREARWDPDAGTLDVPARTAVVLVAE